MENNCSMGGQNKKTDLLIIPGVGKKMKERIQSLGYEFVEDLTGANPQEMFDRDCARTQGTLDRCVLYVYRSAVYYAQTPEPDKEKLDWWYWKDKTVGDDHYGNF